MPACANCHRPRGHGNEYLPRLAGKWAGYIANPLIKFNRRERRNDNDFMRTLASHLTEFEMRAQAESVSGFNQEEVASFEVPQTASASLAGVPVRKQLQNRIASG